MLIVGCGLKDADVLQRFELMHFVCLQSLFSYSKCYFSLFIQFWVKCSSLSTDSQILLSKHFSSSSYEGIPKCASYNIYFYCFLHLDMPEMWPDVNFLFFPSLPEAQDHRWGLVNSLAVWLSSLQCNSSAGAAQICPSFYRSILPSLMEQVLRYVNPSIWGSYS